MHWIIFLHGSATAAVAKLRRQPAETEAAIALRHRILPGNFEKELHESLEQGRRMVSVSTYHHKGIMKDAAHPEGRTDFLPAQLTQADFQKLTKSIKKNQRFLVAQQTRTSPNPRGEST